MLKIATTLSKMALRVMAFSIRAFTMVTFSFMVFSITIKLRHSGDNKKYDIQHKDALYIVALW